jgi:uncharacterized protein with NRDE domain
MCLILFAAGVHSRFPLIVAANRDEAYDRRAAPAAVWEDHPNVYGGRDLERGGTWLGIARNGRFAAITNYRQGVRTDDAARTRGELTRNYLTASGETLQYLQDAEKHRREYHGYSLIAGTPDQLYFYSNRSDDGITAIAPGVHGLSNRLLNEPWPKVQRGVAVLTRLLGAEENDITQTLFDLLADRTAAPDDLLPSTGITLERERALSAAFIAGETYGTRTSTVLLVGAAGGVLLCERTYGPRGVSLDRRELRFQLDGAGRVSAAPARA